MTQQPLSEEPTTGDREDRPLAVVTGASSGIGYELARQFAEHGYDLVIAAEGARLEDAALDLAELGVEVQASQVDLTTYDGVEELYETVRSLARPVDAAAINAGVGVAGDFARETDLAEELGLIQLNVASSVHLAKRVVADMVARGRGRLLFTSSVAATRPGPNQAVYAASTAFIHAFAQALRHELAGTGVVVTTLLPGPTETDFFHRAGLDDTPVAEVPKDDPARVARDGFEGLMAGRDTVVAARGEPR